MDEEGIVGQVDGDAVRQSVLANKLTASSAAGDVVI